MISSSEIRRPAKTVLPILIHGSYLSPTAEPLCSVWRFGFLLYGCVYQLHGNRNDPLPSGRRARDDPRRAPPGFPPRREPMRRARGDPGAFFRTATVRGAVRSHKRVRTRASETARRSRSAGIAVISFDFAGTKHKFLMRSEGGDQMKRGLSRGAVMASARSFAIESDKTGSVRAKIACPVH